jgi:hypothetical protein
MQDIDLGNDGGRAGGGEEGDSTTILDTEVGGTAPNSEAGSISGKKKKKSVQGGGAGEGVPKKKKKKRKKKKVEGEGEGEEGALRLTRKHTGPSHLDAKGTKMAKVCI